jgi:hypothetical protein
MENHSTDALSLRLSHTKERGFKYYGENIINPFTNATWLVQNIFSNYARISEIPYTRCAITTMKL